MATLQYHWPLEDGSGTTAAEVIANNYGTIWGAEALAFQTGFIRGDGTQYSDDPGCAGSGCFPCLYTNTQTTIGFPFALAGRFKTAQKSGRKIIGWGRRSVQDNDPQYVNYTVYVGSTSGKLILAMTDNTGAEVRKTAASINAVDDGQWHTFVANVCTNKSATLYLDKVEQSTASTTAEWAASGNGYWHLVGGSLSYIYWPEVAGQQGGVFYGDVKDLRVYTDACLTQSEINDWHDGTVSVRNAIMFSCNT
jgi:hypothetical protein